MDLKYLSEHYEDKLVQGVAGRIRDLIATQGKSSHANNFSYIFAMDNYFLQINTQTSRNTLLYCNHWIRRIYS